jgi:hypothetical protein
MGLIDPFGIIDLITKKNRKLHWGNGDCGEKIEILPQPRGGQPEA